MQKTKGLSALSVQWQRLSQWLKTNKIGISPKSAHGGFGLQLERRCGGYRTAYGL
jgi:hypothetical protein